MFAPVLDDFKNATPYGTTLDKDDLDDAIRQEVKFADAFAFCIKEMLLFKEITNDCLKEYLGESLSKFADETQEHLRQRLTESGFTLEEFREPIVNFSWAEYIIDAMLMKFGASKHDGVIESLTDIMGETNAYHFCISMSRIENAFYECILDQYGYDKKTLPKSAIVNAVENTRRTEGYKKNDYFSGWFHWDVLMRNNIDSDKEKVVEPE